MMQPDVESAVAVLRASLIQTARTLSFVEHNFRTSLRIDLSADH